MAGGVFGFLIFGIGSFLGWHSCFLEDGKFRGNFNIKNRGCQENTLRTKRQILTTVIGMSWWTNCYVKLHTVDLRMSWWTNCYVKLHRSEDVMVD